MRTVILSPHLDDAVLSCWHVLEGPDDVTVINVFTASPTPGTPVHWWDAHTGATDSVDRMRERRAEDRLALAVVGRESVALDLLDDQYRDGDPPAGAMTERLAPLLDDEALLLAPAAIDGHPDHVLVRNAALALARTGQPAALYADLPHAIRSGWPSWVTGEPGGNGTGGIWTAALRGAGLAVERLVPRVRPLDARTRSRKLAALDLYRTQRLALDDMAFAPLGDPRTLGWEVTWPVAV